MDLLLKKVITKNPDLNIDFSGDLEFKAHDFRFMCDLHECKDIIDSINSKEPCTN